MVFGHLNYELQNSLHGINSQKEDKIGFPPFYFFSPQIVLEIKNDNLLIYAEAPGKVFEEINACSINEAAIATNAIDPQPVLSKEEYIQRIEALREHIHRGDCYEINFCQEFFAEEALIDPFVCFENLMQVSPNPFSAFYRLQEKYLLCASPERFLAKKGTRVFSQPIKGTIKRDVESVERDEELKQDLLAARKNSRRM
jgi:para-aminobenzoate synthetase component 1